MTAEPRVAMAAWQLASRLSAEAEDGRLTGMQLDEIVDAFCLTLGSWFGRGLSHDQGALENALDGVRGRIAEVAAGADPLGIGVIAMHPATVEACTSVPWRGYQVPAAKIQDKVVDDVFRAIKRQKLDLFQAIGILGGVTCGLISQIDTEHRGVVVREFFRSVMRFPWAHEMDEEANEVALAEATQDLAFVVANMTAVKGFPAAFGAIYSVILLAANSKETDVAADMLEKVARDIRANGKLSLMKAVGNA